MGPAKLSHYKRNLTNKRSLNVLSNQAKKAGHYSCCRLGLSWSYKQGIPIKNKIYLNFGVSGHFTKHFEYCLTSNDFGLHRPTPNESHPTHWWCAWSNRPFCCEKLIRSTNSDFNLSVSTVQKHHSRNAVTTSFVFPEAISCYFWCTLNIQAAPITKYKAKPVIAYISIHTRVCIQGLHILCFNAVNNLLLTYKFCTHQIQRK